MREARGAPGEFERRLARAEALRRGSGPAHGPLSVLCAVLRYQASRAAEPDVMAAAEAIAAPSRENRGRGVFPLLDLAALAEPLLEELGPALDGLGGDGSLPAALAAAGRELVRGPEGERRRVVDAWLDDPSLVEARTGFWIRVAAAPILEPAAARVELPSREEWGGSACPACGGSPQVSVIAEETGEFMGGSPRFLVCERCASWWSFPRAVCPWCREQDSRRLAVWVPDGMKWVRVDGCETCHGYVKTFDLRHKGALPVVPLVDDVATLALDLWAHHRGMHRPVVSMAGV